MAPCEEPECLAADIASTMPDVAQPKVGAAKGWPCLPIRDLLEGRLLLDGFRQEAQDGVKGETYASLEEDHESDNSTCDEGTPSTKGLKGDIYSQAGTDDLPDVEKQAWESQSLDSVSSAVSLCSSEPSSPIASVDDVFDFHSPEETIIIFDWDDTICPTTALSKEGGLESTAEGFEQGLAELTEEAKLTLDRAREVASEVIIVTNGVQGWVESSCERWLPDLRATLDCLEYTSARSTWQPMGITTPTGWKVAAFEEILRKFYSRYSQQPWKNVIVIGDGCYEHEALNFVTGSAPEGKCRAKSIRFAPQPSVATLARELQMLRESFDYIVHHDDSLDLNFMSESI